MTPTQAYVLTIYTLFIAIWACGFALFLYLDRRVPGFHRRFSGP